MKQLVVNADDFGSDPGVNAAVLRAHTAGILTSASLMIAAPHAAEAVALAKAHPGLGIGVHLCIVQNRAAAPAAPAAPPEDVVLLREIRDALKK